MTAPLPGLSASPPPNLTPRLAAVSLISPLGGPGPLALDPAVCNQPYSRYASMKCDASAPGSAWAGAQRDTDTAIAAAPPYRDASPSLCSTATDDLDDKQEFDVNDDSRSPSPALTVSNGPTTPPSIAESLAPVSGALTSLSNRGMSSTSSLPSTSGASSTGYGAGSGGPMLVPVPKAEVGFGSLHSEDELKRALSGKERMFVLILGKEFEAFIGRVTRGEYTARVPLAQTPTSSPAIDLSPSKKIDVAATSKYHRMLTYKLAEWYGLRAVLSGIDGSMVVGVLGGAPLDEKATSIKIATLVPEVTAPQTQQFRIMRRAAPSSVGGDDEGMSRGTSVSGGDDGTESSGPRTKTLEERTLAYALARKRIIGDDESLRGDDETASSTSGNQWRPSRQNSRFGDDDDGDDSAAVRSFPAELEYVYPSLYHPVAQQDNAIPALQPGNTTGNAAPPPINTGAPYGFAGMPPTYQGYLVQGMGYPEQRQFQMGTQYPAAYGGDVAMPGYAPPWTQQMGQGMMHGQMPPGVMMPMGAQGWYPPDSGMGLPQPSMMPIIPQGMPYAPSYAAYPQATMPPLAQPTPVRPGMDPLSSTASSISSRSYQDVHSRPHSRGSTTSTRSAASSVRLGAMHPGGPQGYGFPRQKAVKAAPVGFSTMKGGSMGYDTTTPKRNGRQSPASTTSSRSSRRASSIQITQPQPGQHPLPQRPDWAANNVPYHPSPMPLSANTSEPSTSNFPPLAGRGSSATSAEPMQIEKVKMRPSNGAAPGSVWNGTAARSFQPLQPPPLQAVLAAPMQETLDEVPRPQPAVSILPNPSKQAGVAAPTVALTPVASSDADPDFPRRIPSSRTPSLYDPSAPRPARRSPVTPSSQSQSTAASVAQLAPHAPPSGSASASSCPSPTVDAAESTDDVIEARLAALSVKGVPVGPPPQPAGRQPSYAKIVRRD